MAVAPTKPRVKKLNALREASLDTTYVSLGGRRTSSVHEFYRYPARFSPNFAAAAIEAFTDVAETVIDPFGGGGTTVVEAQRLGRNGVSADINSLATFITTAKTTLYSEASLQTVEGLAHSTHLRLRPADGSNNDWVEAGYWRNIDGPETWRIRSLLAEGLKVARGLDDENAEMLLRCALLRTGQWALDMRQSIPKVADFRAQLRDDMIAMAGIARQHRRQVVETWGRSAEPMVIDSGLPESASVPGMLSAGPPGLVLTSPPYPGVYVNYHRWKVRGRKESPAPYWVANCMDGHGLSHYTMSARNSLDLYFDKLCSAYSAIASIMTGETWLVQVVGFSDTDAHLARYLDVMASAGLAERRFGALAADESDGRLWRSVPSRRWWVSAKDMSEVARSTSREVVLIHQLA